MSVLGVLALVALSPLLVWLVVVVVVGARRALRRRGDEATRRRRLARMLGARDLVLVPTADVDLSEAAVLEVAGEAGFRFLGYEYTETVLRRRVGVFVRIGGGVERAMRGRMTAAGQGATAGR